MEEIRRILDRFYEEYNFKERMLHDPIEFPHRYKRPEDIEVAGFIASCLAYGQVNLFRPVTEKILSLMGKSPRDFLMGFNVRKQGSLFSGISYRFNGNQDIICLLHVAAEVIRKRGSLENSFKHFYKEGDTDIGNALSSFIDYLLSIDTYDVYARNIRPRGYVQFFPSPAKGSACKRMNLFLRWMVRDRDIDFGIWKGIPKNKLIIPLDTHIARISRCLGFTERKSNDWRTAVEITNALKELDPEDPLKYDFAMCHYGISGRCDSIPRLCRTTTSDGNTNCDRCLLKHK